MAHFPCPYLGGDVELTDERERHIRERHPDVLPEHAGHLGMALRDPDEVRRDSRFPDSRLFTRRFADVKGGKFVVVVVVADQPPSKRHWIATAYLARKLIQGVIEWKRD